jgi:putative flippase GtrA
VGLETHARRERLAERLLSGRGALLLWRNTVVSVGVFTFGLGLLWLLVEQAGMPKVPAAGLSFMASNSIHYLFGRAWIYRGTDRKVVAGYAYFLGNAVIGLAVTVALFAAFMAIGMHYIVARIVTSIFAGLVLFLLNSILNFRSL